MAFQQLPEDKRRAIGSRRDRGESVLMIGDGLNDAGAMNEANVGLAVTEDSATLVPGCDIIVSADSLVQLPSLLRYAGRMKSIIVMNFALSIVYNIVGLTFAMLGLLTPLVAALFMPISSLSVILISVAGARWYARDPYWISVGRSFV